MNDRGSLGLLLAFLVLACGDSKGGDTDADDSEGDTANTTAGPGATDPDPTAGATSDDSGPSTPGTDPSATSDTGEAGPNFGLLTFTLYPADASGAPAQLGTAGAWRTVPFTTDDFFAVRALGSFFPLAPAGADVLEHTGPGVYDWGFGDSWVGLGNGMRLGGAVACLQLYKDSYPLYLGDDADNLDPACAPDPAAWQPGATYDLSVYGNDEYADETVADAVRTPAALTVNSPDVAAFNFPVDTSKDLAISWTADGEEGDRVVIRMWDQFGELISVHAADDGAYAIPKADLAELSLGAATLTVTREHIVELGLPAGRLRVVARHEVWAYPDLF